MKVAVAIAVVAACVAASLSASITHAPDFAAVGAKVEVVRDIIGEAFNKIKDIANNDNAAVGSDISSQLDAAAVKANAVLERINAAIGAGNLTAGQAQDLFTELTDILTGVFKDLSK
ncbi:hypothetical protein Ocin01_16551 [Orchesella cincta]|uniref:Uncharacterized protein n=1 Tax=Orchesella cincta TaxID=48709 RepID=A0A1D2MAV9_ORCCI|nr:hypothetical protein Ocin01_16551 [Orchesella cincta]